MAVVIGYASAHGSTAGIAERIGARLRAAGLEVVVAALSDIDDVSRFDAAVLGSAVHSRRWLPEAERFVDRACAVLAARPTWLFSVCSVGDSGSFFPDAVGRLLAHRRRDSAALARWRAMIAIRGHRYFAGAVERDHWPRAGDWFLRALGGHYGDHRDWGDVDAWADAIVAALASSRGVPAQRPDGGSRRPRTK